MVKKSDYTPEDIKVLSDREHVRLRTQVYLGNTSKTTYTVPLFLNDKFKTKEIEFIPAVYKAVGEIIDNSLDEFAHIDGDKKLTIEANPILGIYTVSDNGRGVPIGMHSAGKHTPEVVFGSLRSGRNFTDDKEAGVIGQNGVGAACTNYCSTEFDVDITRDSKRYRQKWSEGGLNTNQRPSIRAGGDRTGTTVSFQLDSEVFDDVSLPDELMHNRAIEIALTNPGVVVEYNKNRYKYKKGFEEIIKTISNDYFKFEQDGIEFYVIFDVQKGVDEQIYSWVNSSLLFDGGIVNTQFLNAFYDRVITHLAREAKKAKCEITKNDVRTNLLVLGNHKLKNPEYDAQSKTRLTGPSLRNEMVKMIDDNWSSFSRRNKGWLNTVFERAVLRYHADENKKAIKEHTKNLRRKVSGLVDATSDLRFTTKLLITEGDSAASMITDARDPETIASLPLSGKVNNVYGTTPAQLLNMGKLTDMLTAIGLVPGQKAVRGDLRYGQVIIATDADYDGSDIFTLLINLFYSFWPELFDKGYEPFFHRMVAPNVVASKGNKREHFTTRSAFDKVKDKYKGWTIEYMKGLGSMSKEDWNIVIAGLNEYSIPILDDGNIPNTLELLFGPDAELRRQWLQRENA